MKTAVVYYSLSGNVKAAAEKIAAELGADLIALEPLKPLKGNGFWSILKGGGQAVTGKKPALKAMPDLTGYEKIVLGTPVWAGKCAAPTWTLLASGALKGKTLSVFTSSGSGQDEKALAQIAAAATKPVQSCALVDKAVAASAKNEEKLSAFLENLKA